MPRRLLERRFRARCSLDAAWEHLARVREWPTWARHIREIELSPDGPIGADTAGTIRLTNGIRSTFRMETFSPGRSWLWVGPFLWLTVFYDHRFEAIDPDTTELVFLVDAEGWGVGALGRLFAAIYARNLDRAIPRLIAELERP